MTTFHEELPGILARRNLTPSSASKRIGRDTAYLRKMIASEGELGMSALVALADLTNLTVEQLFTGADPLKSHSLTRGASNALLRFSPSQTTSKNAALIQTVGEPQYTEFLAWFHDKRGDIRQMGGLREFVDIYRYFGAHQREPHLLEIGSHSLASRALADPSLARLKRLLEEAPAQTINLVMNGHRRAVRHGVYCSFEQLVFPSAHKDVKSLTYWRTLFATTHQNSQLIINYCKPITCELMTESDAPVSHYDIVATDDE